LLENFKQIFAIIKQESPSSKLYVQSILPVDQNGAALGTSPLKNNNIRVVNKKPGGILQNEQYYFYKSV